jgi:hypothetical protein
MAAGRLQKVAIPNAATSVIHSVSEESQPIAPKALSFN